MAHPASERISVERVWLVAICFAMLAFYTWTLKISEGRIPRSAGTERDYYNQLSHGFLTGHTYLERAVPKALIEAENPYDPSKRPPNSAPHDISYYRGRFYLYFGAAPIVLLYLPYRLLVGEDLPMQLGHLAFVSVGYLVSVGLLLVIRRRFFPSLRGSKFLVLAIVLGVCGMTLSLLRRASIWELPIASGYMCAMAGLAMLVSGWSSQRRLGWWIVSGLFLGLAVGSRPTYIASLGIVPLILGFLVHRRGAGPLGWDSLRKPEVRDWLGLGIAWSSAVVGLLVYNYARFGNALEFGLSYQLTQLYEAKVRHFSVRFIPYNAYIYYVAPAQFGRYFPFVQLIHAPDAPSGYYSIEYPYGLFSNMPFLVLAFAWPLGAVLQHPSKARAYWTIGSVLSVAFIGVALFLAGFVTGAQRYMGDFAPMLLLLASFGYLALCARSGRWRRGFRVGFSCVALASAIFSVAFAVFSSVQLHGIVRTVSPGTYATLGRFLDYPAYLFEKMTGRNYGALELDLVFPKGKSGHLEPILMTGWEFFADYVYVEYMDERQVRIGIEHTSHGGVVSDPIPLDFDRTHHVRLELGSLYPPVEHPFFSELSAYQRALVSRWARITVDGVKVIDSFVDCYDAAPESVKVGRVDNPHLFGGRFSGKILRTKTARGQIPPNAWGPISMSLEFPVQAAGTVEPLIGTGITGRADMLYVRYLSDREIRMGYDHWGEAAIESDIIHIEPQSVHTFSAHLPAMHHSARGPHYSTLGEAIYVELDGRPVWVTRAPAYATSAGNVFIGTNEVGASDCRPRFSGRMGNLSRLPDIIEPENPTPDRVHLKLVLPRTAWGESDPVFVRGHTGNADVLAVEYTDASHIRLKLDHWGKSLEMSPPIDIDYASIHDIEVQYTPAAQRAQQRIAVTIDRQRVWTDQVELYPATANEVKVGINDIGASTCTRVFRGIIVGLDFGP